MGLIALRQGSFGFVTGLARVWGFEVSSSGVGMWCSEGFVSQIWFQARNSGWCCG